MMSSGDNSTDDEAGEQETFHIYILSFAYGLMMVGWCYLWLSVQSILVVISKARKLIVCVSVLAAGGGRSPGVEVAVEKNKSVMV